MMIIFSYRDFLALESTQVLGLATEQKVGIWEIKEKTTTVENLLGYSITGLTTLAVLVLRLKLL